MRYGLALNLFHTEGTIVPDLIEEFSEYGFDAFSFGVGMMLDIETSEALQDTVGLDPWLFSTTVQADTVRELS